jgi:hypothetical protein
MEKYKFATTETVDEILKEHTIRAIEIAAEMNARFADGNCLPGFEKLYREDCNEMKASHELYRYAVKKGGLKHGM